VSITSGVTCRPCSREGSSSAAETIESAALSLERVHHVECGDGLPLSVLSVGDGVADDVLEESTQHVACLLIDESRDALDTAATSQSANRRLSDPQDRLLEGLLSVALSTNLAVALANLASADHVLSCLSL
jgi:hypothetical protein